MPRFVPLPPEAQEHCEQRLDQLELVIMDAKLRAQSILGADVEIAIAIATVEPGVDEEGDTTALMTCAVRAFSDDPNPLTSSALGMCFEGAARGVYGKLDSSARPIWFPLTQQEVVN